MQHWLLQPSSTFGARKATATAHRGGKSALWSMPRISSRKATIVMLCSWRMRIGLVGEDSSFSIFVGRDFTVAASGP